MYLLCINFYNNIPVGERDTVMSKFAHDLEILQNWQGLDPVIIWGGDFNCHPCNNNELGSCGVVDIFDNPTMHFEHTVWGNSLNYIFIKFVFLFSNDFSSPRISVTPTYDGQGLATTVHYILVSHHLRDTFFQFNCIS